MLMVLLVESAEAWDLSLSTCDTVTPVQGWQLKLGTHDGNSRYDLRFRFQPYVSMSRFVIEAALQYYESKDSAVFRLMHSSQ